MRYIYYVHVNCWAVYSLDYHTFYRTLIKLPTLNSTVNWTDYIEFYVGHSSFISANTLSMRSLRKLSLFPTNR